MHNIFIRKLQLLNVKLDIKSEERGTFNFTKEVHRILKNRCSNKGKDLIIGSPFFNLRKKISTYIG